MTELETSKWKKLAVIAGGGEIPLLIAEGEKAAGRPPYIVEVTPFADQDYSAFDRQQFPVTKIGAMQKAMLAAGCDAVCFIGRITRPDFKSLIGLDAAALSLLPKLTQAAKYGDDALLRVIIDAFENKGLKAVGADEALTSIVPGEGVLGNVEPTEQGRTDAAKALKTARAVGAYDIGQGAVVGNGLVLAVEAQEGTDQMLERVASLPDELFAGRKAPQGVLAKTPKPIQERRIDLPTIGLKTIEGVKHAGLAGIAVEAGNALLPRMSEVIEAADRAGLFILSVKPEKHG